MAIGPNELRQCRAMHAQKGLRCVEMVTGATTHTGDHHALDGELELYWGDLVSVVAPGSGPVGNGSARLSQVGGGHYKKFKIQPWDVIDEYALGFYAGNALKYLLRAGHKGSRLEDLKKCRHYLDKLIEVESGTEG